jgi:AhpD family alkylhydroperoxidase
MTSVNIGKLYPDIYQLMMDLTTNATAAAKDSGLDAKLIELVKIRVSQINGCAYCLKSHVRDAVTLGETQDRLAVLAAWWEAQYFTPEEQAALQLVEQITRISAPPQTTNRGVASTEILTEYQTAAVTWVVIAINSLNRIAITSHYPVSART